MIESFASKETEKIFRGQVSKKLPLDIQKTARRKLLYLDDAEAVVVAYGISARSARGAVMAGREKGLPVGLVKLNTVWPFPEDMIRDLAGRARKGAVSMDEGVDGTFTITNVSMLGMDGFTPVLNPPETGILGVGRVIAKPAVFEGEATIRQMMTLSLVFDHRLVDGAPAARFQREIKRYLEDPYLILALA
jgi:hypothetical protein